MERRHLESAAADYPYLQGLWTIPLGIGIIVAGISNLQSRPTGIGAIVLILGGLAIAAAASLLIGRYYRDHYGSVTPTRDRTIRQGLAVAAWIAVLFVGANQALFWSPDGPQCIYASAFALATLAYYAILVGLRPHHLVIWGAVFVAGLLPIWGGLGVDRDPLAMIPLGLAAMVSGLLDQRLLARSLALPTGDWLEGTRVGG
jgi:drug/metabolite transporter (DMT)-like permease